MRSRRLRVGRALRSGRPIAAEDMALAVQLAEDKSSRLPLAYVQGVAFTTMAAGGLRSMFPWSPAEWLLLVAAAVALGIYLVGIASALRIRRWLRKNP